MSPKTHPRPLPCSPIAAWSPWPGDGQGRCTSPDCVNKNRERVGEQTEECSCFPGSATVTLQSGQAKRMDQLAYGDKASDTQDIQRTCPCRNHGVHACSLSSPGCFGMSCSTQPLTQPLRLAGAGCGPHDTAACVARRLLDCPPGPWRHRPVHTPPHQHW